MEGQLKRTYPKRYVRSRNPKPLRITPSGDVLQILELFTKYPYLIPSEVVQLLGPQFQRLNANTLNRSWRPLKPETLEQWAGAQARQMIKAGPTWR